MKNNIICLYIKDKIEMSCRRLSCFVFGHEPKCYLKPAGPHEEALFHNMRSDLGLPPSKWWREDGKGWYAYCSQHTKEPVRLRK